MNVKRTDAYMERSTCVPAPRAPCVDNMRAITVLDRMHHGKCDASTCEHAAEINAYACVTISLQTRLSSL